MTIRYPITRHQFSTEELGILKLNYRPPFYELGSTSRVVVVRARKLLTAPSGQENPKSRKWSANAISRDASQGLPRVSDISTKQNKMPGARQLVRCRMLKVCGFRGTIEMSTESCPGNRDPLDPRKRFITTCSFAIYSMVVLVEFISDANNTHQC